MSDTEETKEQSTEKEVEDAAGSESGEEVKETEEEEKMEEEEEEKKEEAEEEEEEEEAEVQEDKKGKKKRKEELGLYDKPLVLETGSKRERKKVERLDFKSPTSEKKEFTIEKGKGTRLGDIDYVEFKISRTKAEDLKPLHRLLFKKTGAVTVVKKHIRQFSGFPFKKDSEEFEKRNKTLHEKAWTMSVIKKICETLDILRGGTKDEVCERLLDYLLKPEDTGRKMPKPKRKRKSKGEEGGEKKKRKSKGKKEKSEKKKKSKKVESEEEEEEEEEEDEDEPEQEEEEEEEEEEESDEEVKPPPKKKAKKETPKKETPKKGKAKAEKKTPPKKSPKKSPKKKKEVEVSDISSEDSSDDDEPLIKKKPSGPPSNDEIKDAIKKILEGADLEEVTMKNVIKQVYAKYPSFDLADRKDFIKGTVKAIIS